MEEENVQINNESKKFDLKGFDYKKYLPIAAIVLAVIVVIILAVSLLGGGPKKAVKKYISGLNSRNAKKVISSVDPVGTAVWGWNYSVKDFDEDDYEEFVEEYEEYLEENEDFLEEYKDEMDSMIDDMEDEFDDVDDEYKSYKMKIDEFKKVEKLGKNLYAVKAKISIKAKPQDKEDDEIDEAETMTFVVYKNKIISGAMF